MTDEDKKLTQEQDPLYVDKGEEDLDDLHAQGQLAHSHADDSRINDLDAITYEDHQQVFGMHLTSKVGEGSETDTSGPADNLTNQSEDEVEEE